jgi:hypothetical protein
MKKIEEKDLGKEVTLKLHLNELAYIQRLLMGAPLGESYFLFNKIGEVIKNSDIGDETNEEPREDV